jgi:uncharacterized membrane protein YgcG
MQYDSLQGMAQLASDKSHPVEFMMLNPMGNSERGNAPPMSLDNGENEYTHLPLESLLRSAFFSSSLSLFPSCIMSGRGRGGNRQRGGRGGSGGGGARGGRSAGGGGAATVRTAQMQMPTAVRLVSTTKQSLDQR